MIMAARTQGSSQATLGTPHAAAFESFGDSFALCLGAAAGNRLSSAAVPVGRIGLVSFDTVQPSVDPGSIGAAVGLDDFMSQGPFATQTVPDGAQQRGSRGEGVLLCFSHTGHLASLMARFHWAGTQVHAGRNIETEFWAQTARHARCETWADCGQEKEGRRKRGPE